MHDQFQGLLKRLNIHDSRALRKLVLYSKLVRLNAPTGYLLSFFPAAYGLILGAAGAVDFKLLIIFFIGSILARSAGCIVNDILDHEFDSQVARTKGRVIANKEVSLKEAIILCVFLLSACLAILLTLKRVAIYIGIFAFCMIMAYPLMKRLTNLAQVFLGITFNLGALIGYAESSGQIGTPGIILYIATIFWTIGYDTIYGFMDIEDDKRIGLNSMAILLENKNYKLWLGAFYSIFIALLLVATYLSGLHSLFHIYYFVYILISICLIYFLISTLDISQVHEELSSLRAGEAPRGNPALRASKMDCHVGLRPPRNDEKEPLKSVHSSPTNLLERFKMNGYIGILLLVYLLHY
jgi:4-hydroxybenzoate polyprenyltransferase